MQAHLEQSWSTRTRSRLLGGHRVVPSNEIELKKETADISISVDPYFGGRFVVDTHKDCIDVRRASRENWHRTQRRLRSPTEGDAEV